MRYYTEHADWGEGRPGMMDEEEECEEYGEDGECLDITEAATYRRGCRTTARGWKDMPHGWTKESLHEMWNDLGGSVDDCIKKMEGDVDDPGAYCASLADEVEPGWRHRPRNGSTRHAETFDYNVGELDELVKTAVFEGMTEGTLPEHGVFEIPVDIRSAMSISSDITELERTINAASLIASYGGRYFVEAEGPDVVVLFEARPEELDNIALKALDEEGF